MFWPYAVNQDRQFLAHVSNRVLYCTTILKGIYDTSCVPQFDLVQLSEDNIRTRGNNYKLIQHHCRYDLRQESLANANVKRATAVHVGL